LLFYGRSSITEAPSRRAATHGGWNDASSCRNAGLAPSADDHDL
jgi:hypothetical protein